MSAFIVLSSLPATKKKRVGSLVMACLMSVREGRSYFGGAGGRTRILAFPRMEQRLVDCKTVRLVMCQRVEDWRVGFGINWLNREIRTMKDKGIVHQNLIVGRSDWL